MKKILIFPQSSVQQIESEQLMDGYQKSILTTDLKSEDDNFSTSISSPSHTLSNNSTSAILECSDRNVHLYDSVIKHSINCRHINPSFKKCCRRKRSFSVVDDKKQILKSHVKFKPPGRDDSQTESGLFCNLANGLKNGKKRSLANIQERKRMHRLNDALDRLRELVPKSYKKEKMFKKEILHAAIAYIKDLQEILKE